MVSLQKKSLYHITFSDTITFCLPDIHEVDMERLKKSLKNKDNYFYLGCLQINLRSESVYAYFTGCRMKNGVYFVSDVDPLCRNSYSLPIHCSRDYVYTVLGYLLEIYKNTEGKRG